MREPRVGIIDSGVGGITVWAEIVRLLGADSAQSGVQTVYYADTANCPYGVRSDSEIVELTRVCVDRLLERGVDVVVLACNTITAAAVDVLRDSYRGVEFVGMEPAVKPAVMATRSGVVGILATRATLRGRLYHNTAQRWAEGVTLVEVAGDGLVEMVEDEQVGSAQCDALLMSYLDPMVEAGADCVVLGCTHYPFLSESIGRLYGDRLQVIQPAVAVAQRVKSLLVGQGFVFSANSVSDSCSVSAISAVSFIDRYVFISSLEADGQVERLQRIAWGYYNGLNSF